MKLNKKLLSVIVAGLFLTGAASPRFAYGDPTKIESSTVMVSTSMVTGATQLLSAGTQGAFVILYSTGAAGETIAIDDVVGVSTNSVSGSFRFPVGTVFELGHYNGPLYAIGVGASPFNVRVLRKR